MNNIVNYETVKDEIKNSSRTWLITGVAGFIGSNLLETLLKLNQSVVGLDNFVTGHQHNLDEVEAEVTREQWSRFKFIEGDIINPSDCNDAVIGVDYVLHQAALGSVPRSIKDPLATNAANINGFLNILIAARDANVSSFTYAASSSTYGDHPALPKKEPNIGNPLSPYAVTKYVNELYSRVFSQTYGLKTVGLRYFNVFGKRQDPKGAYAAVIPKWTAAMIAGEAVFVNGDGETSRDFCFVDNVVQANILAATVKTDSKNEVYNVAVGNQTSLNMLFSVIKGALEQNGKNYTRELLYRDFRVGDVRHSQADITKAQEKLGYSPSDDIFSGIDKTIYWYLINAG